jgi:uncharacterized protein YqkB
MNINEGHEEVKSLENMVRDNFGEHVEMFVHTDGCLPVCCAVCTLKNCAERKSDFERKIDWNVKNVSFNSKHTILLN